MAYEALYRRYRPSRFADVAGQAHVVSALRNAVEADRVGHAYLFSGPRGTGKTSSARILAKALNCTDLQGGEPCDRCDSCQTFLSGGSYDLHELDAASNNGVDAMRDLIGKVALGSPGRTKVYILDEVHMLTGGAENALLKTLEEPPSHVVFVLCTTEPNKVVPTIRSRTQHLEFSLLSDAELGALVDHVVADAGLALTDADRSYVIRAGAGSARDTLSALDRVVAAGGAPQGGEHLEALFSALVDRDSAAALLAIDGALQSGRDPAAIAASLLADLRDVFLAAMRSDVDHMPENQRANALRRAAELPPARITRAVEVIGASAIEMRQAPDPRVDLEVAIVRLTRPDLDVTPEALLERIEALERRGGGAPVDLNPAPAGEVESRAATEVAEPSSAERSDPGDSRDRSAPGEPPGPDPAPARPTPPAATGRSGPDIVRAALAEQQQGTRPESMAVAAARPDLSTAPKLSRTLADVRAERRGASAEEGEPSSLEHPASPSSDAAPQPGSAEADSGAPTPVGEAAGEDEEDETAAATGAAGDDETAAAAGARGEVAGETDGAAAPESSQAASGMPTLDELQQAWDHGVLDSLSGRARSRFSAGRFMTTDTGQVVFGLPNPVHRDRCAEIRDEVDRAMAAHFGRPVELELLVDTAEAEPDFFSVVPDEEAVGAGEREEEHVDLEGLVDAGDQAPSAVDRVLSVFEGSMVVEDHPSPQPGDGR